MGSRNAQGYGVRYVKRFRSRLVHRQMWEMAYGPIPDGVCVLHSCDNPACFRLDHLFLGTRTDNAADRHGKGRTTGQPKQTYCRNGHLLEDHAYVNPRTGNRTCRTCKNEWQRRRNGLAVSDRAS